MSLTSRGTRRFAVASAAAVAALSVLVVPQSAQSAPPACGLKLAILGALTGPAASLGVSTVNGSVLAINQYNAQHPGCTVGLAKYDSQGLPSRAVSLAPQIVGNSAVVGVVGPAFSGEALATGRTFAQAGLTTISPSATNPSISRQHWATFHRIVTNDTAGGPLLATYVRTKLRAAKVAVVTDKSDYGKAWVRSVRAPLGKRVVVAGTIREGQTNFKALAKKVKSKRAKVVVFGGYYPEAGLLAKQLVKAGFKGAFVTGDGSMDPAFTRAAGAKAAARSYLVSSVAPSTLNASFTSTYRTAYGRAPGLYALESYDATRIFLAGIGQGAGTRAAVLSAVNHYNAAGLTKKIAFTSSGELTHQTLWVYKPQGRGFVVRTRLTS